MTLKRAKCDLNGIKIAIFFKKYKKLQSGWRRTHIASGGGGLRLQSPYMIRLSYITYIQYIPASVNELTRKFKLGNESLSN